MFRNVNVVFMFIYLSVQHVYRMTTNWGGWDMDITTYTMLLTCRLWSVGFVVADGAKKDELLTDGQVQRKMVNKPSLLEFVSYSFFGPNSICGPFFEIKNYIDFIEQKGIY